MITKAIDFDGYNEAEILYMYEDGTCACTLRKIEDDTVIKQDTNIILTNGVHFELTDEELLILQQDASHLLPIIQD